MQISYQHLRAKETSHTRTDTHRHTHPTLASIGLGRLFWRREHEAHIAASMTGRKKNQREKGIERMMMTSVYIIILGYYRYYRWWAWMVYFLCQLFLFYLFFPSPNTGPAQFGVGSLYQPVVNSSSCTPPIFSLLDHLVRLFVAFYLRCNMFLLLLSFLFLLLVLVTSMYKLIDHSPFCSLLPVVVHIPPSCTALQSSFSSLLLVYPACVGLRSHLRC